MIVPDLLRRSAAERPDFETFRDPRRRVTASAAVTTVDELGIRLQRAGLRARDRLAIVGENDVATPLVVLAAQGLGAWPAVINARVGPGELASMRECARPRVVIYLTEASTAAKQLAASAQTVRDGHPQTGTFELEMGAAVDGSQGSDEDVALLLFTSGTTGRAKAVMWSHGGLIELGRVLAQTRSTSAGSVVQCAGPLSHIMGISNFMAALSAGATLQLMARLDADALVKAVVAGELTHLSLVPTAYQRVCDYIEATGRAVAGHGLRYISSGGAPLDATLKARVERLFGLRLVNAYGMTECAPGSRTRPDQDSPPDCIGWPEPGVEMRVDVAAGEVVGELLMRTRTKMIGYYGAPGETAAVLRPDGWVATGDLATWLPDGSIRLVGRRKELIIRSGFNVYPGEVETALSSLPGVSQAAVVGLGLPDGNEEIVGFVRLQPGTEPDKPALFAGLALRLAPYKRPARIEFVEEFPLGPTGKIAKRVLLERLDP